jgi:hypothetical protein
VNRALNRVVCRAVVAGDTTYEFGHQLASEGAATLD